MATQFQTSSSERNELSQATLRFLVGWHETQEGIIRPGGHLIIWYDSERLPNCRQWWHGALIWDNEVFVRFRGSARYREDYCCSSSTQKEIREYTPEGIPGPVIGFEPKPVIIAVPIEATQVEMWFHSWSDTFAGRCDAWDSRFGQNYWYDVVRDQLSASVLEPRGRLTFYVGWQRPGHSELTTDLLQLVEQSLTVMVQVVRLESGLVLVSRPLFCAAHLQENLQDKWAYLALKTLT